MGGQGVVCCNETTCLGRPYRVKCCCICLKNTLWGMLVGDAPSTALPRGNDPVSVTEKPKCFTSELKNGKSVGALICIAWGCPLPCSVWWLLHPFSGRQAWGCQGLNSLSCAGGEWGLESVLHTPSCHSRFCSKPCLTRASALGCPAPVRKLSVAPEHFSLGHLCPPSSTPPT